MACTATKTIQGSSPPPTAPPSASPDGSPAAAPKGAGHLTSGGTMLVETGTVQTAPIKADPAKTVLVGVSTLTGDTPAPIPSVTGGGGRWTRLASVAEVRDGVGSPRRLTLFEGTGVRRGPLTISVPPVRKQ